MFSDELVNKPIPIIPVISKSLRKFSKFELARLAVLPGRLVCVSSGCKNMWTKQISQKVNTKTPITSEEAFAEVVVRQRDTGGQVRKDENYRSFCAGSVSSSGAISGKRDSRPAPLVLSRVSGCSLSHWVTRILITGKQRAEEINIAARRRLSVT